MANEQNLRPSEYKFSHEDSVKGGKASVASRRRRKAFAEAYEVLLQKEFTDHNGNRLQGVEAIAVKTFQLAMNGNLKAMQIIRDTVGEMPVQKVELDTIDSQARAEMDELLGLE